MQSCSSHPQNFKLISKFSLIWPIFPDYLSFSYDYGQVLHLRWVYSYLNLHTIFFLGKVWFSSKTTLEKFIRLCCFKCSVNIQEGEQKHVKDTLSAVSKNTSSEIYSYQICNFFFHVTRLNSKAKSLYQKVGKIGRSFTWKASFTILIILRIHWCRYVLAN